MRLADGRSVIVKARRSAPEGFFEAESRGLAALRDTATVRVPDVLDLAADRIVLEDLGQGSASPAQQVEAGARLARLHRSPRPYFGFPTAGWCGDSAQDNTPSRDGIGFFVERRLLAQLRRARDSGLIDSGEQARIERIGSRLDAWIPPQPPVLVHGDLWTGNLHACANGELALIDGGAVHFGWAETDLAMLTLFGEPGPSFFDAYQGEAGIDKSWRERGPLYNLYHLLNHLNLFGRVYLRSILDVTTRFA